MQAIVIMAGGTGGHIFPAMAVAKQLMASGCPVYWIGTDNSMEAKLVPQHNVPMRFINIQALRGKGLMTKLLLPLRLLKAIVQAIGILRELKPAAVLGMGGFVTGPGGVAAWLLRKPLIIHEQNAVAGMTNRYLARLARHVYEAFPHSFDNKQKTETVGNPIRSEIVQLHAQEKITDLNNRPLHLLVVGGSLGALFLNETVPKALAMLFAQQKLTAENIEIRHQTGERTYQHARTAYAQEKVNADIIKFIDDMAAAYAWADVIICRAGALTVSEVAAAGVPSIFVPFPHAVDDHQRKNAEALAKQDAAIVLVQKDLSPESLANSLYAMIQQPQRLQNMSQRAKAFAQLNAADVITQQCLHYAREAA
ncbi:MAG: undecaprenyldiphospho-muramoylpentapeptide beta-N-acetylglucosaminyltransferase [Gammaproteobacteria bacterium]|nr:undecaprenyldiphospho-muramoylpentapeptide beta-N-acetylglucosaminyltransferase [Gammaproteobacteria bacterium]